MHFECTLKSDTRLNSKHEACVRFLCEIRCVCVCVGDNPLHEGLFAQRAIHSEVQGLEMLHHHQFLFLSSPSLAISPSLYFFLLSLHSRHFSPIFLAAFSPSNYLNHPLFCPLSYIRHRGQLTDDLSLQIFVTVPVFSIFFCSLSLILSLGIVIFSFNVQLKSQAMKLNN